jgi:retinol-binding protein 3
MNPGMLAGMLLMLAPADASVAPPQAPPQQVDLRIDPNTRTQVIEGALRAIADGYVFPDIAAKVGEAIRRRMDAGEYDHIDLGPVLADVLTFHLKEASADGHLGVQYRVDPVPAETEPGAAASTGRLEAERLQALRQNFGFERVERLRGNVGYLDLRSFERAGDAGPTAAAAMAVLANTDALIVDLRQNGGGEPSMVALLAGYLFPAGEPVHLNDLYWRAGNRTEQWWTQPYLPGSRYAGKDVYVLVSSGTFSAAEEFAYDLKSLKRATIVGETTGGGANPGDFHRLAAHFTIFVPGGRAINPVTKSNWERTGVVPDVAVPAGLALETAHLDALRRLQAKETDPESAAMMKDTAADAARSLEEARAKSAPPPVASLSGNTRFHLAGADYARRVTLVGRFNRWDPDRTPLARDEDGWTTRIDLPAGHHAYLFVVDGRWMVDPENAAHEQDRDGNVLSVLVK